jgi:hypothetical protein
LIPHYTKQPKALIDRRKHTQRQTVHFQQAKRVYIVFVPLNKRALGHCPILQWDNFAQWSLGDDKTADMLGKMTRETQQLYHQPNQHLNRALFRFQPGRGQSVRRNGVDVPPVQRFGQGVHAIQ